MYASEELDRLSALSDSKIFRLVKFILDGFCEIIDLKAAIHPKVRNELPVQARYEYLSVEHIRKILDTDIDVDDVVRIFLLVDQAISLMPLSEFNKLVKLSESGNVRETVEIVYEWCSKVVRLCSRIRTVDRLYAEDDVKQDILMVVPSERQFSVVIGKWDQWLWHQYAYDGSSAPSAKGWLEDVAKVADVLSSEGVRVHVAVDRGIEELARSRLHNVNIVTVDIPENMPKIGYVRDQSLTLCKYPILCNMVLDLRRGEEHVVAEIYSKLGLEPVLRLRWGLEDGRLVRAHAEGGNFVLVRTGKEYVLFTGSGIRGTNLPAVRILSSILPDNVRIVLIPIVSYIRKWELGAVHLDVAFTYVGDVHGVKLCLIDSSRVCTYLALEYDRDRDKLVPIELLRLFKELDIYIDEPPDIDAVSKSTGLNFLNLGKGKLLADAHNHSVNKYLEKQYGLDVIEIPVPQFEAGGGGIRCATRELWL